MIVVKLTYEMDPELWGEDLDGLTDEEVLELAAEDWLEVIKGADASVERVPSGGIREGHGH